MLTIWKHGEFETVQQCIELSPSPDNLSDRCQKLYVKLVEADAQPTRQSFIQKLLQICTKTCPNLPGQFVDIKTGNADFVNSFECSLQSQWKCYFTVIN